MRTVKTTTSKVLLSKIEKLTSSKQLSKSSLVYGWLLGIAKGETIIRPVFVQGRTFKHSSLIDKTDELTRALSLLNVRFGQGNDAPRGGKTGAFVRIDTKVKISK
jgi:hypothetical protein